MPPTKKCPHCSATFSMTGHLNRHILTHTAERPHSCPFPSCQKTFSRADNLRQHIVSAHEPTVRPYQCPHESCGKKFVRRQQLTRHIALHDRPHPFECTECGDAFRKRNQLAIHMSIHTGKLPYVCQEDGCGKEFRHPSALRKHSRVHNLGERRFVCYCNDPDAAFAKFSQLQKHVKEKHPAPPKECEDCGKRFRTKAALERHRMTHTEGEAERNHWCQVAGCTASYVYRKGLLAHVRAKHTNVQRFSCKECSFKTSYKMALKRHMIKIHKVVQVEKERGGQEEQREVDGGNYKQKRGNVQKGSTGVEREDAEQKEAITSNHKQKRGNAQKERTDPVRKFGRRQRVDFTEDVSEEEDSEDGWSVRDTDSESEKESELDEGAADCVAGSDGSQDGLIPKDDSLEVGSKGGNDTGRDRQAEELQIKVSAAKRIWSLSGDGDQHPRKRRLTTAGGHDTIRTLPTLLMTTISSAENAPQANPSRDVGDAKWQPRRAEEHATLLGALFGVDETVETFEPSNAVATEECSEFTTAGFRAVTGTACSFIT